MAKRSGAWSPNHSFTSVQELTRHGHCDAAAAHPMTTDAGADGCPFADSLVARKGGELQWVEGFLQWHGIQNMHSEPPALAQQVGDGTLLAWRWRARASAAQSQRCAVGGGGAGPLVTHQPI